MSYKTNTYKSFLPLFKNLIKSGKYISYLEWGCGIYSTALAINYLGVDNVISVENNAQWADKINKLGARNIHLKNLIRDEVCEYVTFPSKLNKKFDFMFIDGRNRVLCMKEAKKLLNKNGIVMLHDIHRKKYLEGIKDLYAYEYLDFDLDTGVFSNDHNLEFLGEL